LLEDRQHVAAHEAGRADHRYIPTFAHIPKERHPFSAGRTLQETPRADKVRGSQNGRETGPYESAENLSQSATRAEES
jgi:hypothetical protein